MLRTHLSPTLLIYSTKYFLAPRPSFSDDWNSAYSQYDAYYIPMVISDGTTNYYANEQGIVTIPVTRLFII